jgi:heterodisulfide reductase subunit C
MTGGMAPSIVEIGSIGGSLAFEVTERSGASPMSCYQCAKCSSGCPVAARGDLKPHEVVRLVQTNQQQAVLASRFIWECTSCQTCTTRCPQKVDLAGIVDALRKMSRGSGAAAPSSAVPVFNEVFLDAVRDRGRVFELGLMIRFKLRTRRFLEDAGKAPMMLRKGKLALRAARIGGKDERKALFDRAAEGGAK